MSVKTTIIPVATVASQENLVEIIETVCKPYCINSSITPSASVVFTQGANKTINGNIVCPVTATVTVVTPSSTGCGCARTQVFTEVFDLAFNAGTTNVVTIAAGDTVTVEPYSVKCCKARGIRLLTTLTATIA